MWMLMDSNNDHSREFKLPPDTAIGRKLRPLMPRPLSSSSSISYSTPSCCCIRNPNILSSNHSISGDEGVKREIEVVSTRWNPTPEQLQVLEEMYGRGIRTPSADQIQQTATKLGRFGKIQGKNVFYWFQNHKARDRQKMKRRQLHLRAGKNTQTPPPPPAAAAAQGAMNNREHEKKKKKKVHMASNCSMATEEDYSASMHGAVIAAAGHKELQQSPTAENEIRWQLHLDSSTTNRLGQTEWVKERRECMRWMLCCPQLDKTNHNKTSPFLPPTVAHSEFGGATE